MPAPKKSGSSRRKASHHGHAAPLCFRGALASARLTRAGPLERRERKLFLMFLAPGLLLGIGAIFLPVLYAIQLSFYYAESFVDTPKFVGFANYTRMFADPRYWQAFVNGLLYAVSTVFASAYWYCHCLTPAPGFRGRNWLRSAAMAPYILPTVVVVYIWKWVLDVNHGLINAALDGLGLGIIQWFGTPLTAWISTIFVSVWHWTPFVTITFLAALQTMSDDLYDAAAVDGANAWQRLVYVTLPVLKPVLVVIIMLRSIFMFNKFDIVWLLTAGGPLTATEHLPILAYQRTFRLFDIGGGASSGHLYLHFFDPADLALLQTVSHRGAWLDATLTMDDCTPCAAASPLWRCDHLFAVSHVLDGHFRAAGPTGAVSTAAPARTLGVEKLRYDSAPDRLSDLLRQQHCGGMQHHAPDHSRGHADGLCAGA